MSMLFLPFSPVVFPLIFLLVCPLVSLCLPCKHFHLSGTGLAATGLTLTAAHVCFILEPLSNAAEEAQALARVHRIGQVLALTFARFCSRSGLPLRSLSCSFYAVLLSSFLASPVPFSSNLTLNLSICAGICSALRRLLRQEHVRGAIARAESEVQLFERDAVWL
jgi:hypothetical protein